MCQIFSRFRAGCRIAAAALVLSAAAASASAASILISEINSNGAGGDFFELYNYGVSPIDLGGWKWVDNASVANGGPSFNGARAFAFDAFTLQPGGVALVVTDASGGTVGNDAFATSWGLTGAQFLTFNTGVGTGNGLGQNDLVAVFNAGGTFVTGLNYGTAAVNITQGDNSTVSLAPFNRVIPPGGTSLGGHTGIAGGGTSALQSLIWDPTSDPTAPLYTAASSVGLYGSFENPNSVLTIGSPSIVPEPSTVGLGVAAGLGLAGLAARRRLRKI
jgi:hypothetical protein